MSEANKSPRLEMNEIAIKFESPYLDIESIHGKWIIKVDSDHVSTELATELVESLKEMHGKLALISYAK